MTAPAYVAQDFAVWTGMNVRSVLRRMARMARTLKLDPLAIGVARSLAVSVPQRDAGAYVEAIRRWVSARWRYVPMPVGAQLLDMQPAAVLRSGVQAFTMTGACADAAVIIAALGEAIGIPARFVAVKFDQVSRPYTHVYTSLLAGGAWRPLDITRPLTAQPRPVVSVLYEEV